MRNKPVGRGVVWAVATVLVGVAVVWVGVWMLHNPFVTYVGLTITGAPLLALWFRR